MLFKNKIFYIFEEISIEFKGIFTNIKEFLSTNYINGSDKLSDKGYFIFLISLIIAFLFDYNEKLFLFIVLCSILISYNVYKGFFIRKKERISKIQNIRFEIEEARRTIEFYAGTDEEYYGLEDVDGAKETLLYYKKYI
jgi:hypothetical protein